MPRQREGYKVCSRCRPNVPLEDFRHKGRAAPKCRAREVAYEAEKARRAYFQGRSCAPPDAVGKRGCMYWPECRKIQLTAPDAMVRCEKPGNFPLAPGRDSWLTAMHEDLRPADDPLRDLGLERYEATTPEQARRNSKRWNERRY